MASCFLLVVALVSVIVVLVVVVLLVLYRVVCVVSVVHAVLVVSFSLLFCEVLSSLLFFFCIVFCLFVSRLPSTVRFVCESVSCLRRCCYVFVVG